MAAIVVSQTINRWTGNEKSAAAYRAAIEPNSEAARKDLETMLLGLPHFEVYGTTDTNTDGVAINLNDAGVTFPDGTHRVIKVVAHVADVDGQGIVTARAVVDGGATPIVTVVQDTQETVASGVGKSSETITGGLGGIPTLDIDEVSNEVEVQALGISGVDCRWVIHVWVSDAIPLAYYAG